MKKTIKAITILALTIIGVFALTSCEKSGKVTGLTADFFEVSWDEVDGADEYAVIINDTEYHTENTYFELFEYVKPGVTVRVGVEAIFDGYALKGDIETVSYTAEEVTKGLVFEKLEDNTYAVYCPEEAFPENGELVLPDTYNGCYVTGLWNPATKLQTPMSISVNNEKTLYSDYSGTELTKISKIRLPSNLTAIGNGALYKASIKSIYIPETVTDIYEAAFLKCGELERVSGANERLTNIYNRAFAGCSKLSDFKFPENLINLGGGAFADTAITEVSLPNIVYLNNYTFYNCGSLDKISLSDDLERVYYADFLNTGWYNSQPDGLLYLGNILYGYKGDMPENTELTVKPGIKNMLLRDVFKDQKNLASITLPEGITEIQIGAFRGCENLREVILPVGLTAIGANAFKDCKSLKEIDLPEGLLRIESGAFNATGLESITLPQSLEYIGDGYSYSAGADASDPHYYEGAFAGCTNLKEIVIPKNTRRVGDCCFYGCTGITKIIFEDGVKEIGIDAFIGCTSLKELIISDSVESFYFHSIAYTGLTHFVFPKNIEFIYFYSPRYQNGMPLDYVVIQNGTKLLDYNWFYVYSNLDTFYFEGTKEDYEKIEKISKPSKELGSSSANSSTKEAMISAWLDALTVFYYSEEEPEGEGNYWHYVDGLPSEW